LLGFGMLAKRPRHAGHMANPLYPGHTDPSLCQYESRQSQSRPPESTQRAGAPRSSIRLPGPTRRAHAQGISRRLRGLHPRQRPHLRRGSVRFRVTCANSSMPTSPAGDQPWCVDERSEGEIRVASSMGQRTAALRRATHIIGYPCNPSQNEPTPGMGAVTSRASTVSGDMGECASIRGQE
jgi:hypothetical protein